MENLKLIIDEILKICHNARIDPSPDMVLDCATRIFNAQNIELSKLPKEKKESNYNNKSNDLITDKQINLMVKLKIPFTKTMTKLEAKTLIEEYFEEKRKNKEAQIYESNI